MNLLNIFKPKVRAEPKITPAIDDVLLKALIYGNEIDSKKAMEIPTIAACINLICDTVSMIPVKLYKEEIIDGKRKTALVTEDLRPSLLNDDTKDTLDGVQFKKAMVRDYLLNGNSYAYINKKRNKFVSVNYVPANEINILKNNDPIFKDYNISVQGVQYKPFEFLKILRATKDGTTGNGIIEENREFLNVSYNTLLFEKMLVSTGGNKKGFINSKNRLSKESMQELREAWNRLYSNNDHNMIILNDGLTFQEASQSSMEMQLNENKKMATEEIQSIFGIPQPFDYNLFIKQAIMPILTAIECALNRDFLLEKEKNSLYFAFDTKEITKGDVKTRFEAYKLALECNLMTIDECRYMEDLEPMGFNFYKLGLQDVLYNPKTEEIFTPNTGKTANMSENILKGGNFNENESVNNLQK